MGFDRIRIKENGKLHYQNNKKSQNTEKHKKLLTNYNFFAVYAFNLKVGEIFST